MAGRKPGAPKTGGRQRGTPNKFTRDLKAAILAAAEEAGGEGGTTAYLVRQAIDNPGPFMTLLGKVLPMQLTGDDGGPIQIGADEAFSRLASRLGGVAAGPTGGDPTTE